ncbi:hypothetical protein AFK68_19370 [Hydrocoleum sp. CS-953]|uniref:hypothetical protein n=1 Tax=Hydrocoleum sp. CS-953 TaxID=1671698 RepID=UPI000B9BBE7E|nr:hypothetical protein [Hydrocoleum sp. CS-953]OZH53187.1 hypothetical protein AFK68_19370 [Hydrocoleum sp. CS-953]
MATLKEDIKIYRDELYTKGDIKAGLAIIAEALGYATVMGVALYAIGTVSAAIPFAGIPFARQLFASASKQLFFGLHRVYTEADSDKRKLIRVAVKCITGQLDVGLLDVLGATESMALSDYKD